MPLGTKFRPPPNSSTHWQSPLTVISGVECGLSKPNLRFNRQKRAKKVTLFDRSGLGKSDPISDIWNSLLMQNCTNFSYLAPNCGFGQIWSVYDEILGQNFPDFFHLFWKSCDYYPRMPAYRVATYPSGKSMKSWCIKTWVWFQQVLGTLIFGL